MSVQIEVYEGIVRGRYLYIFNPGYIKGVHEENNGEHLVVWRDKEAPYHYHSTSVNDKGEWGPIAYTHEKEQDAIMNCVYHVTNLL